MTIKGLVELTGAELLTKGIDVDREVEVGYACDMLSWVMSHAKPGMVLITVQSHMNVIAVATMMDMSAVIVPEGIVVDAEIVAKAAEEGLAVLASELTAYELSGLLYGAGVAAK